MTKASDDGRGAVEAEAQILIIAGSDSSGGAGLQRDALVAADLGIRARFAVTAVTAQSDQRAGAIWPVPERMLRDQIEMALRDMPSCAVKVGMVCNHALALTIATCLSGRSVPIVVDPVLQSSSGAWLVDEGGRDALRDVLFPEARIITPNRIEAALLTGEPVAEGDEEALGQAKRLCASGAAAVLMKGGHARGDEAADLLVQRNEATVRLAAPRLRQSMRGTGCALSTAIAIHLARGCGLVEACWRAKLHVHRLIAAQPM
jgi:hydroxymethylpyrimidine/phosphomethylpyrimidine kinase